VRQHEFFHILSRPDEFAWTGETLDKIATKLLEQMNMLGLFAGELQQRPHPVIIAWQLLARMIHRERQDELFHQAEHGQVLMAANLVQDFFLFIRQKAEPVDLRQRLRHKRLGEIQPLVAADNIFNAPVDAFRSLQHSSIAVIIIHDPSSVIFYSAQRRCHGSIAQTMPKPCKSK
jgi:hypothetical protein